MGGMRKLSALVCVLALVSGCTTTSPNGFDSVLRPIVEKRDTLMATGYAVIDIQDSDMAAQRRLLAIRAAKLDAYRSLTEQVYGQYLDSTVTVSQMAVKSDTFRSRVEGVIYGATVVRIEPVGTETYEVTMALDKALVNDLRLLYLNQVAFRPTE
ncbi:hypothetical protein IMCC3088_1510 [Aequoribacter fuscus]|uniref:Lipoprotein LPP20-like domain-containing protein n=1 Tax=Aequoribacter fuscus TaxID=2518989 RepID=F3L220_9GAMM|nr:LPP20 family lipoprotein [Aequoribacter fuscus]EGG29625.1 hypothetical protein IMCC3088_1510 [Aequoribacter fuscus]